MNLEDFRTAGLVDVAAPPVESSKMIILGPARQGDDIEIEVEEIDDVNDDLEWTYELDGADLETLKENYNLLWKILEGLLEDEVKMPIEMVKELEVACGDMHHLINEFVEFKPEDAGVPQIAVTLEDAFRGTNNGDLYLPESS
jgi:hypothetical protein